jgi:hypothetical protein
VPRAYSAKAIEDCFQLYLRHNGQHHDLIEREMQRKWPHWSKQNLYTRGEKIGWVERYGWEKALERKLQAAAAEKATTSAEGLFLEIEKRRKQLDAKLDAEGCENRDLVYQHQKYCELSISALARLEAARDNRAGFAAFWERLMEVLPGVSPEATRALLEVDEAVFAKVAEMYGG